MALTPDQIEQFVEAGFVKLARAFSVEVGEQCRRELWSAVGGSPDDPSTWTRSYVRLGAFTSPPFRQAANTASLHEAFDQLVGAGRWIAPAGLGTFPLRFPSTDEPLEAGWHVEAGFAGPQGEPRLNVRSRERALLMLFLFSEVGPDDAPTMVRAGSHLDVPQLLAPAGDAGLPWMTLCERVVPVGAHRRVELATGSLGDVYLCHPFLVHSGSAHHGRTPRFMAQPPLRPTGALNLESPQPTPVERAVIEALRP